MRPAPNVRLVPGVSNIRVEVSNTGVSICNSVMSMSDTVAGVSDTGACVSAPGSQVPTIRTVCDQRRMSVSFVDMLQEYWLLGR